MNNAYQKIDNLKLKNKAIHTTKMKSLQNSKSIINGIQKEITQDNLFSPHNKSIPKINLNIAKEKIMKSPIIGRHIKQSSYDNKSIKAIY